MNSQCVRLFFCPLQMNVNGTYTYRSFCAFNLVYCHEVFHMFLVMMVVTFWNYFA